MSDEATPDQPPPEKPKKKKRLTRKQAKAARERVKDPDASLSEIAKRSGYADKTNVHTALNKPHVQDRIRDLMDANPNLTEAALAKKLEEGLQAKEIKFFAHEGEVVDERETVDYAVRHRYLETAADWRGISEKRVKLTMDPPAPMTLEQAQEVLRKAQGQPPKT